ncbi:metal ABC transporter solute-binding protein, Zn/Mn family [Microbacterium sp. Leaf179]|uniref:metal ABC transporter solute-binding protein, Zn/Mn family n=1 Tax=Microbacterium sp. Leaf179 TaxID=1736288 RepID=UPI0009EC85C9|nr:zinc ABC transporter substrate-binding protein [Microbacterium sp. Leaf179]
MTRTVVAAIAAATVAVALAGCSQASSPGSSSTPSGGKIVIVAAENEYADVASQIGGDYVSVDAILSDPNTDPHTFEADPSVAKELSTAQILIQNGLGYDDFMTDLASASPNADRKVIDAQEVLGVPDDTENPHLWYNPATMPAVAQQIEKDLAALDPSHESDFKANLDTFNESLKTWTDGLASFQKQYGGTPVAVTEPVADYMLEAGGTNSPAMEPSALSGYTAQAAGVTIKTPWSLQAAIMNDTDPSPQDSAAQDALFTGKQIKVFLYNQQVTDDITTHYLDLAKQNGIPVVGVYETMPLNYTYQQWMEAELTALQNAVANGTSTESLG